MTTAKIPAQMKAAAFDQYGPPEAVHVELVPVPKVGPHDVLVEVATAGVGVWDPEMVNGSFTVGKVDFPQVIGSDGAGVVRAIGEQVTRFAIGDRVYGWGFGNAKGGFYAEFASIGEKELAHLPKTIALDEAGALTMSGITALLGLEHLELVSGDPLMILGASGGVGHVATQLAKRLDLRVFAVASGKEGVALVERLGADTVVDGHHPFQKAAREFAPDGFAGALVFSGGHGWKDALELVASGRHVAWPNGVEPEPTTPRGLERHAYDAAISQAALERLSALVARGPFHVHIMKTYGLEATAQALRDVQQHHLGKLAIKLQ
ncbi:MAG: Alcohol dehydrogenase zinc-binding domain protein [Myxococcales bacterium]|nr:Alcohol dehydrogenase zinc-binding domain protein [Myxococcales bacterium]